MSLQESLAQTKVEYNDATMEMFSISEEMKHHKTQSKTGKSISVLQLSINRY